MPKSQPDLSTKNLTVQSGVNRKKSQNLILDPQKILNGSLAYEDLVEPKQKMEYLCQIYQEVIQKSNISEQDLWDYKQAFDFFDQKQEGFLEKQDLTNLFNEMGFTGNQNIEILLKELNLDTENQQIDFTDFLEIMTSKFTQNDNKEDLERDLKIISEELGDNVDDQLLLEMIRTASGGQQSVKQDQFIELFQESLDKYNNQDNQQYSYH
ncbi:hypothetical protein PPERSA_06590 [Pseudocohnilembus persalinus]|uniref:EF-hand domain-containing protein n=1 Tax=Pseudocohnilembus persalinus TaxID=266149 RepID=A0A0V0QRW7_PSEPJ|nr:hypothetical protein PPERSA_06590 [Pseudocohnilembus persalinus]|eukprot:KRX04956.1 hypothetical protein PPERSA_06590 [Pseudocohnilembus persalinus]